MSVFWGGNVKGIADIRLRTCILIIRKQNTIEALNIYSVTPW